MVLNDERPIYLQIMGIIEDDILSGIYPTDGMIISTTQIAKLFSVNPTTAVKAVSTLADKGVIYKKRGIGMAVTQEAREIILNERRESFYHRQLFDFIETAEKLGIPRDRLAALILETEGEPKHD